MQPKSFRPINCRPCLLLSESFEERHLPPPTASGSTGGADLAVRLPANPPTPLLRSAEPSIRPSGERRPANRRLPDRLSLEPLRALRASGDRSVILQTVGSRLATREPQMRSQQREVPS